MVAEASIRFRYRQLDRETHPGGHATAIDNTSKRGSADSATTIITNIAAGESVIIMFRLTIVEYSSSVRIAAADADGTPVLQ